MASSTVSLMSAKTSKSTSKHASAPILPLINGAQNSEIKVTPKAPKFFSLSLNDDSPVSINWTHIDPSINLEVFLSFHVSRPSSTAYTWRSDPHHQEHVPSSQTQVPGEINIPSNHPALAPGTLHIAFFASKPTTVGFIIKTAPLGVNKSGRPLPLATLALNSLMTAPSPPHALQTLDSTPNLINTLQTALIASHRMSTPWLSALAPSLSVSILDFSSYTPLTDAMLSAVASFPPSLKTLVIDNCSSITAQGISSLASLQGIQTLSMQSIESLQDAALANLPTTLESLNIRSCPKITNTGVASLGRLTNLTSLNIARLSKVTDKAFASLGTLTRLEELNISHTGIDGAAVATFATYPSLTFLDATFAITSATAVKHLSPLTSLKELQIGQNRISDTNIGYLTTLTNLETLSVRDSSVSAAGIKRLLPHLASLTSLDVARCRISSGPSIKELLEASPPLQALDISFTANINPTDLIEGLAPISDSISTLNVAQLPIDDAALTLMAETLPNITHLALQGTSITDVGLVKLKTLPLVHLDISNTSISQSGLPFLATVASLESLVIRPKPTAPDAIADKIAAALTSIQSLKHLSFNDKRLTDSGAVALARLTSLESLTIARHRISDKALAHLLKALPCLKDVVTEGSDQAHAKGTLKTGASTASLLSLGSAWKASGSTGSKSPTLLPAGVSRAPKKPAGASGWDKIKKSSKMNSVIAFRLAAASASAKPSVSSTTGSMARVPGPMARSPRSSTASNDLTPKSPAPPPPPASASPASAASLSPSRSFSSISSVSSVSSLSQDLGGPIKREASMVAIKPSMSPSSPRPPSSASQRSLGSNSSSRPVVVMHGLLAARGVNGSGAVFRANHLMQREASVRSFSSHSKAGENALPPAPASPNFTTRPASPHSPHRSPSTGARSVVSSASSEPLPPPSSPLAKPKPPSSPGPSTLSVPARKLAPPAPKTRTASLPPPKKTTSKPPSAGKGLKPVGVKSQKAAPARKSSAKTPAKSGKTPAKTPVKNLAKSSGARKSTSSLKSKSSASSSTKKSKPSPASLLPTIDPAALAAMTTQQQVHTKRPSKR